MRVLVTDAREAGNPCGVDCRVESSRPVVLFRRCWTERVDPSDPGGGRLCAERRKYAALALPRCSRSKRSKRGLGRCTNVPGTSSGAAVSGWRTGSWDEPGTISAPSPSTILSERHLLGGRQDHRRSDRPTADDLAGVRGLCTGRLRGGEHSNLTLCQPMRPFGRAIQRHITRSLSSRDPGHTAMSVKQPGSVK